MAELAQDRTSWPATKHAVGSNKLCPPGPQQRRGAACGQLVFNIPPVTPSWPTSDAVINARIIRTI